MGSVRFINDKKEGGRGGYTSRGIQGFGHCVLFLLCLNSLHTQRNQKNHYQTKNSSTIALLVNTY